MSRFVATTTLLFVVLVASVNGFWIVNDGASPFQFSFTMLDHHGGVVVAYLNATPFSTPSSKAGVMMRATLASPGPYVMLNVKTDGSLEFVSRNVLGAISTVAIAPRPRPLWLRLSSNDGGSQVEGAISSDAASWTSVGLVLGLPSSMAWVGGTVTATDQALNLFDSIEVVRPSTSPTLPTGLHFAAN